MTQEKKQPEKKPQNKGQSENKSKYDTGQAVVMDSADPPRPKDKK
jgi:hypothetical protein